MQYGESLQFYKIHAHTYIQVDSFIITSNVLQSPSFWGWPIAWMKSACHLYNLSNLRHNSINIKLCINIVQKNLFTRIAIYIFDKIPGWDGTSIGLADTSTFNQKLSKRTIQRTGYIVNLYYEKYFAFYKMNK